jgi:hypothetical protein
MAQLLSVKWEKCEDLPAVKDESEEQGGAREGGEGDAPGKASKQQQAGGSEPSSRGLLRFMPHGLGSMLRELRGHGDSSR